MEIGMLVNLLNNHNLTIGRCYHQLLCVAVEVADRTTVEVERTEPKEDEYSANE
jgi:hypothetical protein